MVINTIYSTYQGEVNIFGIGHPVIFIRKQGCHLRCYVKTLGILCDTPEALATDGTQESTEMTVREIVAKVDEISVRDGGIKLICFSGGDPLYGDTEENLNLLWALGAKGYHVSIETSGTLSIAPYRSYTWVSFVIDYKSKSAGLKSKFNSQEIHLLDKTSFIKFVLYDEEDYTEFFAVVTTLQKLTPAKIAVGCYWGGKLSYEKLVQNLKEDMLFGSVVINMQAHKMITLYDKTDVTEIIVPREI